MILLDTNVVSEPMKSSGDPLVSAWLDEQVAETLYLAATSLAELLAGVELLPVGRRRDKLAAGLADLLVRLFAGRILPFDRQAAIACSTIIGRARSAGRAIAFADAQIAAIAKTHGFSVATRDTAPFEAASVPVIDPWRRQSR
jgi:toxin FitB